VFTVGTQNTKQCGDGYSHPADVSPADHGNLPQDATTPLATSHSRAPVSPHLPSDQEWTAQTALGHTPYCLTNGWFHSLVLALVPLQHVTVRYSRGDNGAMYENDFSVPGETEIRIWKFQESREEEDFSSWSQL
jgi:hypothetical protein